MDPEQYVVYSNARKGKFEGIGVALVLTTDSHGGQVQVGAESVGDDEESTLPKLMIAQVVPGSSADRAGLKPGDWVEYVDDHWIPNSEAFERFRKLTEQAKKHEISSEQFLKVQHELQEAAEKNILAIKARDRLMMGDNGIVSTVWNRAGKRLTLTLEKGDWQMPGFGVSTDGTIRLPFVEGIEVKLREALKGKSEATIDLRNNFEGDYDAMVACLDTLAPKGSFGFVVNYRGEKASPFTVTKGTPAPIKLKLIVDRTTRGSAEIFARVLAQSKVAALEGGELGGSPFIVRWTKLPSGAGYTLVTGEYRTKAPQGIVASTAAEQPNERGVIK
jgi:C-terminal processing protease CtpA/Prc